MADVYTAAPLSPLRRAIAARMSDAKRQAPHFRLVADLEVDGLLALKGALEQAGQGVSLNTLFVKACALALMDAPQVNVQLVDGELRQFSTADISVVTAVPGGLSTPVLRRADSKSIWQIAEEMRALAERASQNRLRMEEILGGSFSISNLGMYGVTEFDAIINTPQCAILALGAVHRVFAPDAAGAPCAVSVVRATLSLDHRAVDGVAGAEFIAALRRRLANAEALATAPETV